MVFNCIAPPAVPLQASGMKGSQVVYKYEGQAEPHYDNDPEVLAIMEERDRQRALEAARRQGSRQQIRSSAFMLAPEGQEGTRSKTASRHTLNVPQ